eukprot:225101-Chlamydomonas_euryale.AAC.14
MAPPPCEHTCGRIPAPRSAATAATTPRTCVPLPSRPCGAASRRPTHAPRHRRGARAPGHPRPPSAGASPLQAALLRRGAPGAPCRQRPRRACHTGTALSQAGLADRRSPSPEPPAGSQRLPAWSAPCSSAGRRV